MPGYKDKRSLKFRVVPEMVPEFIVPDLTNFEVSEIDKIFFMRRKVQML